MCRKYFCVRNKFIRRIFVEIKKKMYNAKKRIRVNPRRYFDMHAINKLEYTIYMRARCIKLTRQIHTSFQSVWYIKRKKEKRIERAYARARKEECQKYVLHSVYMNVMNTIICGDCMYAECQSLYMVYIRCCVYKRIYSQRAARICFRLLEAWISEYI